MNINDDIIKVEKAIEERVNYLIAYYRGLNTHLNDIIYCLRNDETLIMMNSKLVFLHKLKTEVSLTLTAKEYGCIIK